MGYTICDKWGDCKPLRMITVNVHGVPEVKAEFTPFWWTCDACNMPDKRYAIEYSSNQDKPSYFQWFEVVTTDDDESDIKIKVEYYKRVLTARKALDEAGAEYRRLVGCGWSVAV